jgi:pantoate--beta-alanine ligase
VKILTTIAETTAHCHTTEKRKVLVPTMGALHNGHLELIRVAREHAGSDGEVLVSIFVNPLQFEPGSDYARYLRPEENDERLCAELGVDALFRPADGEMYAADRSTFVEETALSESLCGRSRPGHFRGVCTVVTKLFNVVTPDVAVFGEKDYQQLAIIRRLVRDLNFPIEIIGVPIVREPDGLALSSRNNYLSEGERAQATALYRALSAAVAAVRNGERRAQPIVDQVRAMIESVPLARVDYIAIVNGDTLQQVDEIREGDVMAMAVFFGKTRLIDNMRLL